MIAKYGEEKVLAYYLKDKSEKRLQFILLSLRMRASKKYKSLKGKENLRDHMSDLELIFSMLGEASAKEITVKRDAQGFPENLQAAREGGTVAGNSNGR